jgi:hypothetical protein
MNEKTRRYVFSPAIAQKHKLAGLVAEVSRGKQTRGRNAMLRYFAGEPISRVEAMLAKCSECMCWHFDGLLDCENPQCSMYPWMPYRRQVEESNEAGEAWTGQILGRSVGPVG